MACWSDVTLASSSSSSFQRQALLLREISRASKMAMGMSLNDAVQCSGEDRSHDGHGSHDSDEASENLGEGVALPHRFHFFSQQFESCEGSVQVDEPG